MIAAIIEGVKAYWNRPLTGTDAELDSKLDRAYLAITERNDKVTAALCLQDVASFLRQNQGPYNNYFHSRYQSCMSIATQGNHR